VPEDRQRDGIVAALSIRENISLAGIECLKRGPFVSTSAERKKVRDLCAQLNLKAEDLELPVTSLSGGNQQKAVLARCLMRSPSVLLLDEPTRGVDVGALSDNILVLSRGRVTARTPADTASEEQLFAAACSHLASGKESR
jgi:erythritol transport system ATP-binding protein